VSNIELEKQYTGLQYNCSPAWDAFKRRIDDVVYMGKPDKDGTLGEWF